MNRREFLAAAASLPISLELVETAAAIGSGGRASIFVTADLESHVAIVDAGTARVSNRIRTLAGPRSIENVDGSTALVAHTASGRLSLIDGEARNVRAVVEGFAAPRYTAARGPLAYVTDSLRRELVTVDVHAGRIVSRARVPGPARHVTVMPDGEEVWTSLGSTASEVAVLDVRRARRPQFRRTFRTPFLAHDVVAAPDGTHVWLTSGDSRRFAVYDRARRRPLAVVSAGAPPQHVAFVGRLAFVASGDDGTVRVHRLNGDFVRQAEVPAGSYNVAYGGGAAVTPSLSRGTVAVLDEGGRVRAVRRIARAAHDACVVI
jgi:DNA-binding beta-propeller fold protein YncE